MYHQKVKKFTLSPFADQQNWDMKLKVQPGNEKLGNGCKSKG